MRLSKKSLLVLFTTILFLGSIAGLYIIPADKQPDTAIHKGLDYEKAHISSILPDIRLMFDYLERKYGIDQVFSAATTPILSPAIAQGQDPAQFMALRRIAYPDSLVTSLPDAQGDTQSQMLMAAANCDHIALPADYKDLVEHNLISGKYDLTHVELALKLLTENNCAYFTSPEIKDVRDRVAAGMAKLAANPETKADLRYESIALLLDMGRSDLVPHSWLLQIISEQLPTGGWSDSRGSNTPNDHTTLLAVWTLLQLSHPTAPNEPMIRRPN